MTPATAMGDMLPACVPLATMTAIKKAGIFALEANSMHGAAIMAQITMAPGPREDKTKGYEEQDDREQRDIAPDAFHGETRQLRQRAVDVRNGKQIRDAGQHEKHVDRISGD